MSINVPAIATSTTNLPIDAAPSRPEQGASDPPGRPLSCRATAHWGGCSDLSHSTDLAPMPGAVRKSSGGLHRCVVIIHRHRLGERGRSLRGRYYSGILLAAVTIPPRQQGGP
jgi:hypothetical protein